MKVRTRFIQSVIKTAKSESTRMPWSRGVTRDILVAARRAPATTQNIRTA